MQAVRLPCTQENCQVFGQVLTIQLTRKFWGHNPDFLRRIRLCPQDLLKSIKIRHFSTYAE
jgi:hypothetical protein